MANEGYIVITDITGYTMFLSESELEHAESVLRALLGLLVDHTDAPLQISRLEGDAVISFALGNSLLAGSTLVDKIENTYVAFRRALQQMVLNTNCKCRACANMVNLDLKFFVHYGDFIIQRLTDQKELVGSDVNLAFRLTKNTITSATGIKAYVAYTADAIVALGLPDFAEGLVSHEEPYEHLGQISLYVQDLHPVWKERADEVLVTVRPEDVLLCHEEIFPIPPSLLWEYLTEPRYRQLLFVAFDTEMSWQEEGRPGDGSVYVCAHGQGVSHHTIVEWHPFDQMCTISEDMPGVTALTDIQLTPVDGGTRLRKTFGKPRGPWLKRLIFQPIAKRLVSKANATGIPALKEQIEADLAAGKVQPAEHSHLDGTAVAAAAQQSLRAAD